MSSDARLLQCSADLSALGFRREIAVRRRGDPRKSAILLTIPALNVSEVPRGRVMQVLAIFVATIGR